MYDKPNLTWALGFYSFAAIIITVPDFRCPNLPLTGLGTASIQNNNNFTNHYYLSGALITDLAEDIKFKPAAMLSYSKGVPVTANVSGIIYLKEMIGLGINYRTDNQAAGIISVNMNSFKLGYAYQFGVASNNLGGNKYFNKRIDTHLPVWKKHGNQTLVVWLGANVEIGWRQRPANLSGLLNCRLHCRDSKFKDRT